VNPNPSPESRNAKGAPVPLRRPIVVREYLFWGIQGSFLASIFKVILKSYVITVKVISIFYGTAFNPVYGMVTVTSILSFLRGIVYAALGLCE
jgi:hypothetical protein